MKRTEHYLLKKINEKTYLLPYGQMIADLRQEIELNSSSEFLWNELPNCETREELFQKFTEHFDATEDDLPVLQNDFEQFLSTMISYGLVEVADSQYTTTVDKHYSIAELTLSYHGPDELIPEKLSPFSTSHSEENKIDFYVKNSAIPRPFQAHGTLLIRNSELEVCETNEDYILFFPTFKYVDHLVIEKGNPRATLFCLPVYPEILRESIFQILRFVFLYYCRPLEIYGCHSASIHYNDQAWLFCGSSGTGKSTHTNLWHELYDTKILNGDMNLLGFHDSTPVVYGSPWCGTSGISSTETVPLGGIVILSQSTENQCHILTDGKQILALYHRFIVPCWDERMVTENLAFAEKITQTKPILHLACTPTPDAVAVIKHFIDKLK